MGSLRAGMASQWASAPAAEQTGSERAWVAGSRATARPLAEQQLQLVRAHQLRQALRAHRAVAAQACAS